MTMRRFFLLSFLFCSLSGYAQVVEVVGKSEPAMVFTSIPVDAVLFGKGGAGLASSAAPEWASFGNIASPLFNESHTSIGVSYLSYTPGEKASMALGVTTILSKRLVLSAGYNRQKGVSYQEVDATGNVSGSFSPSDTKVNVGLAYSISDACSVGSSIHYLHSGIASELSLTAYCADVMAFTRIGQMQAAAGIRNLGPGVKDSKGTVFNLPTSACVAAEYTIEVGSSSELCADADVEYCFSTGLCASVAAEYIYNNMFFLRTGGHFGKGSIPSFASAGLGAKVFGASLNVAYIFASETLVGSWMLGLGYAF